MTIRGWNFDIIKLQPSTVFHHHSKIKPPSPNQSLPFGEVWRGQKPSKNPHCEKIEGLLARHFRGNPMKNALNNQQAKPKFKLRSWDCHIRPKSGFAMTFKSRFGFIPTSSNSRFFAFRLNCRRFLLSQK